MSLSHYHCLSDFQHFHEINHSHWLRQSTRRSASHDSSTPPEHQLFHSFLDDKYGKENWVYLGLVSLSFRCSQPARWGPLIFNKASSAWPRCAGRSKHELLSEKDRVQGRMPEKMPENMSELQAQCQKKCRNAGQKVCQNSRHNARKNVR